MLFQYLLNVVKSKSIKRIFSQNSKLTINLFNNEYINFNYNNRHLFYHTNPATYELVILTSYFPINQHFYKYYL